METEGWTQQGANKTRKQKRKDRLDFARKYLKERAQFWKKIDLRTDETTSNWSQNDGKRKVWTWRETALRSACG